MISKTTNDKLRRLQNKVERQAVDLKHYHTGYWEARKLAIELRKHLDNPNQSQFLNEAKALLDAFEKADDANWQAWNDEDRQVKRDQRVKLHKLNGN